LKNFTLFLFPFHLLKKKKAFSDISFLFPITPATPMGEITDSWASTGRRNMFGQIVEVYQMQSEAGVAGSIHGATAAGASVATYTCSQG